MFKVIIAIMTTFFVCRLPTWIFLLIKLNRTEVMGLPQHWVVHFSLGILSLANCAINPFLYTFLSETIRVGSHFKEAVRKRLGCCFPEENYEKFNSNSAICNGFLTSCFSIGCGGNSIDKRGNIDKNLIDYGECDQKFFKRKSYAISKFEVNNISSTITPTNYNHLCPAPQQPDSGNFVEIDLCVK